MWLSSGLTKYVIFFPSTSATDYKTTAWTLEYCMYKNKSFSPKMLRVGPLEYVPFEWLDHMGIKVAPTLEYVCCCLMQVLQET